VPDRIPLKKSPSYFSFISRFEILLGTSNVNEKNIGVNNKFNNNIKDILKNIKFTFLFFDLIVCKIINKNTKKNKVYRNPLLSKKIPCLKLKNKKKINIKLKIVNIFF
tara:strand:+ start:142 stop:465 length:324 start_codon:yes stop_codon:yes gene_type:complete